MDKAKKAAAIARLEAEEQRRIEEKIAAGAAVLQSPPVVVTGAPSGMQRRDECRPYLRVGTDESGRDVYHDNRPDENGERPISVIVTGVPRAGRDDDDPELFARYLAAIKTAPSPSKPYRPYRYAEERARERARPPQEAPPMPTEPESEPRQIRTQIERPTEKTHGVIIERTYTTAGNLMRVRDMDGRLFTERFAPGDDLDALARRLLRERGKQHGSFYDPIRYRRIINRWQTSPSLISALGGKRLHRLSKAKTSRA